MKSALARQGSVSRIQGPRDLGIAELSPKNKRPKSVTFDHMDEIIQYIAPTPEITEDWDAISLKSCESDTERPLPSVPSSSRSPMKGTMKNLTTKGKSRHDQLMNQPKYQSQLGAPFDMDFDFEENVDMLNGATAEDEVQPGHEASDLPGASSSPQQAKLEDASREMSPEPSLSTRPILQPPMDLRMDAIMSSGSGMSPKGNHSRQFSDGGQEAYFPVRKLPMHSPQQPEEAAQWRSGSALARQDSLQDEERHPESVSQSLPNPPAGDLERTYSNRRKDILRLLDPYGAGVQQNIGFGSIPEEADEIQEQSEQSVYSEENIDASADGGEVGGAWVPDGVAEMVPKEPQDDDALEPADLQNVEMDSSLSEVSDIDQSIGLSNMTALQLVNQSIPSLDPSPPVRRSDSFEFGIAPTISQATSEASLTTNSNSSPEKISRRELNDMDEYRAAEDLEPAQWVPSEGDDMETIKDEDPSLSNISRLTYFDAEDLEYLTKTASAWSVAEDNDAEDNDAASVMSALSREPSLRKAALKDASSDNFSPKECSSPVESSSAHGSSVRVFDEFESPRSPNDTSTIKGEPSTRSLAPPRKHAFKGALPWDPSMVSLSDYTKHLRKQSPQYESSFSAAESSETLPKTAVIPHDPSYIDLTVESPGSVPRTPEIPEQSPDRPKRRALKVLTTTVEDTKEEFKDEDNYSLWEPVSDNESLNSVVRHSSDGLSSDSIFGEELKAQSKGTPKETKETKVSETTETSALALRDSPHAAQESSVEKSQETSELANKPRQVSNASLRGRPFLPSAVPNLAPIDLSISPLLSSEFENDLSTTFETRMAEQPAQPKRVPSRPLPEFHPSRSYSLGLSAQVTHTSHATQPSQNETSILDELSLNAADLSRLQKGDFDDGNSQVDVSIDNLVEKVMLDDLSDGEERFGSQKDREMRVLPELPSSLPDRSSAPQDSSLYEETTESVAQPAPRTSSVAPPRPLPELDISLRKPSLGESISSTMRSLQFDEPETGLSQRSHYTLKESGSYVIASSPDRRAPRHSLAYDVYDEGDTQAAVYNQAPIPRNRSTFDSFAAPSTISSQPSQTGPQIESQMGSRTGSSFEVARPVAWRMPSTLAPVVEPAEEANWQSVRNSESTPAQFVAPQAVAPQSVQAPRPVPQQASHPVPQQASHPVPQQAPHLVPQQAPQPVPQQASQFAPQQAPQPVAAQQAPQQAPQQVQPAAQPIQVLEPAAVVQSPPRSPQKPVSKRQPFQEMPEDSSPMMQGDKPAQAVSPKLASPMLSPQRVHLQNALALEPSQSRMSAPYHPMHNPDVSVLSEASSYMQVINPDESMRQTSRKDVAPSVALGGKLAPTARYQIEQPLPKGLLYLQIQGIALKKLSLLPANTLVTVFIDNGVHSICSRPMKLDELAKYDEGYRVGIMPFADTTIVLKLERPREKGDVENGKRENDRGHLASIFDLGSDGSYAKFDLTPLAKSAFGHRQKLTLIGQNAWSATSPVVATVNIDVLYAPCVSAKETLPAVIDEAEEKICAARQLVANKPPRMAGVLRQFGGDVAASKGKSRYCVIDPVSPLLVIHSARNHRPRALINLAKATHIVAQSGNSFEVQFRNKDSLVFQAQNAKSLNEWQAQLEAVLGTKGARPKWIDAILYES